MLDEFQKLSEGFDFIEESAPFSATPLNFEETSNLDISESISEKSPYRILGRVKGCFAPISTYSRNRRLYENDHWNYVLQDNNLQERLKNREIFGEIGHQNKKVDDFSNRAGDISHIVTKMEVREDKNGSPFLYGEFEILDTPAGRILEAMYKGGAGLYVSSRAAGKLKPIPGNPNMQLVCKESYYLNSWDVVISPGFLAAKPVYEAIPTNSQLSEAHDDYVNNPAKWVKEPNAECQYRKEKWEEATKKHSDLKQNDLAGKNPETQAAYKEAIQAYKDLEKARKDHYPNYKTLQDIEDASEDLATLKLQVEQLAQIMEKVVDSIYEQPSEAEQPVEESTEVQPNKAEPLAECISLLAEANIDEEAFEQVLEIIRKGMN